MPNRNSHDPTDRLSAIVAKSKSDRVLSGTGGGAASIILWFLAQSTVPKELVAYFQWPLYGLFLVSVLAIGIDRSHVSTSCRQS